MIDFLKDGERLDELHINDYKIIQHPEKFCFGIDAVLLSDFAKAKSGDLVLDIGTGTAIIPILMSAKTKANEFHGIDVQYESIEMSRRSIEFNDLNDKIFLHHIDVKELSDKFQKSSFDVVTSNPPYMNEGGGILNEHTPKAIARHEILCTLEDVVKSASGLLKSKGRFYMVHRPNRLCDIICTLRKYKLEPKTIRFVQPYDGAEPNIILIESIKDGGAFLKYMQNLIVYNEDRSYTREIDLIYGRL